MATQHSGYFKVAVCSSAGCTAFLACFTFTHAPGRTRGLNLVIVAAPRRLIRDFIAGRVAVPADRCARRDSHVQGFLRAPASLPRRLCVLTLKLRRCVGVCQRQCCCPSQVHHPAPEPVSRSAAGALASFRHGDLASAKEFAVPCLSPVPSVNMSLGRERGNHEAIIPALDAGAQDRCVALHPSPRVQGVPPHTLRGTDGPFRTHEVPSHARS